MSNAPTTLAERIARLNNQANPTAAPPARTTGAVGRLSDTRKRFEDPTSAPLIVHGSFGLGKPSTVPDKRDTRSITLGSGRASLPAATLRKSMRSVSEGITTTSGHSSNASTPPIIASPQLTPTTEVAALDLAPVSIPSPVLPSFHHLDSGVNTPVSISSLNVETGSDGGRTIDDESTTSANASPLRSPEIEIQDIDDLESQNDSFGALKGPIASLRGGVVRRTTSALSVSSLQVEVDEDEDVANLHELTPKSTVITPAPDFEGTEEDKNGLGLGGVELGGEEAQAEKDRVIATNTELMQYEEEIDDLTAVGSGTAETQEEYRPPVFSTFSTSPTMEANQTLKSTGPPEVDVSPSGSGYSVYTTPMLDPTSFENHSSPKEGLIKEEEEEGDGGYGDILDDFTDESGTKVVETEDVEIMPVVKCSDCNEDVDLVALPDHTCSTSTSAHALPVDMSSSSISNTIHTSTLDDFVPQSNELVPEDIDDEQDEFPVPSASLHQSTSSDPYDIYDPEDSSPSTAISNPSPEVPSDIPDDAAYDEVTLANKLVARSKLVNRQSDSSLPPKSRAVDHNSDDEDLPGDRGWATVSRKT